MTFTTLTFILFLSLVFAVYWSVRHRVTQNVGKLLGEAAATRARFAAIIGRELDAGQVVLKDLDGGHQEQTPIGDVAETLRARLGSPQGGDP